MEKILFIILINLVCSIAVVQAKDETEHERLSNVEAKCLVFQTQQAKANTELHKLSQRNKIYEAKLQTMSKDNKTLKFEVDSLKKECRSIATAQESDRNTLNGKIDTANRKQMVFKNNTIGGGFVLSLLLIIVLWITFWLFKRMKKGYDSIDRVRQVQEALKIAQQQMQEESIKLDNKLLDIADKKMVIAPNFGDINKPDHSLALKVADEIVRIELNMSRMDSSIKGYKQLSKAVERIKDNFKANGYEIIDMLGKPYNEGMKVTANFVADENLEEGKQIITGITKPQINYNGQMIQAAQITVSQNI